MTETARGVVGSAFEKGLMHGRERGASHQLPVGVGDDEGAFTEGVRLLKRVIE